MKQLTNKHYGYICRDIDEWYGVKLTVPQMKNVLKNKPVLAEITTQTYLHDGLDTSLREEVVDAIAINLTGKRWPVGATSKKESKRFFLDFIRKAEKKNIKTDIEI